MVDKNIVGLADFSRRLRAEAAHRGGQGEHPDGRADRHVLIARKVDGYRLNRHGPAVHPVAAAPPEARRPLRPLGGAELIDLRAAVVRLLIGEGTNIAHAGEEHDQPLRIFPDAWIVRGVGAEGLLLLEHARGVSRGRLRRTEEKIGRGHKIQRKNIKLNADPEHQRHPEHAAEHRAAAPLREQQSRRRQVGHSVDNKQRPAGKDEVLKKHVRERQHLEKRQHRVHSQRPSAGVQQHTERARHGAQTDKQRPEDENAPRRLVS